MKEKVQSMFILWIFLFKTKLFGFVVKNLKSVSLHPKNFVFVLTKF